MNERKHESSNINNPNARSDNEVENEYASIENSFDVLRENHGVNIAFDKSGQRKLILEIPFRETRNHPDGRNSKKLDYLVDGSDMTEKETPIKRIEKIPIDKKNIPGTFEKIKIHNYTLHEEIPTESEQYSSFEGASIHDHEIDRTDGTNNNGKTSEPQNSGQIQNPQKYYRQNGRHSDISKYQSTELSSFSNEDKDSSETKPITKETGKSDMYMILICLTFFYALT